MNAFRRINPARRIALVTGGTDGIGKEIARGLARAGFHVLIVGHDAAKGKRAAIELGEGTGDPRVEFIPADLRLISETEKLAEGVQRRFSQLNRLVTNAGIVLGRRELTSEGIESNFAINYLSRFVLIRNLLPLLERSGAQGDAARILLVSGAARSGRIYFDDVNLTKNFGTLRAVGQFCKANDLLTKELACRMEESGQPVSVNCLKIGVVRTNIRHGFPRWMKLLVPLIFDPLLGQTREEAATAALRLLLGSEFEDRNGARFLKIRALRELKESPRASDQGDSQELWKLSLQLEAQSGVQG